MVHRLVSEAQSGVESRLRALLERGEGPPGARSRPSGAGCRPSRPTSRSPRRARGARPAGAGAAGGGRRRAARSEEEETCQQRSQQRRRSPTSAPGRPRAQGQGPPREDVEGNAAALSSAEATVEKRVKTLVKRSGVDTRQARGALRTWRHRLDRERKKALKQLEGRLGLLQARRGRSAACSRASWRTRSSAPWPRSTSRAARRSTS